MRPEPGAFEPTMRVQFRDGSGLRYWIVVDRLIGDGGRRGECFGERGGERIFIHGELSAWAASRR
jgi:hypothetical protein